jgi:N-acetyl-gamma-glutamyl-phosphate reductase
VHRHVGEIEAFVRAGAGVEIALTFCPHLLPVKRGILTALHLKGRAGVAEIEAFLEATYASEPFVRVVDAPPRLSDVVDTNECRISVHEGAAGRVVVFSAIDNLLKGAAGQALQNLNLALGLDETAGLPVLQPGRAGATA